jgi:hypothetical protein
MKDKHLKYIILSCLILIILIGLYIYALNKIFCSWTEKGTFGDSFGALNTLFSGLAFAGVIFTILIQKEDLKNQKNEFLLNRITTLIYDQLERFERAISKLKISDNNENYIGDYAISYLNEKKSPEFCVTESRNTNNEELERKKQKNRKHSELYIKNKLELENFAHNIYNSVEVVKNLLYTSPLNFQELNELKKLFFDNIGFITMEVIEHISDTDTEQLQLFEENDYTEFSIKKEELKKINRYLKPVKDFYNLRFTKENHDSLKKDWRRNSGLI